MKLYYLSFSIFADNQLSILKHLANHYQLTYAAIIPTKNANYSNEELSKYCKLNRIDYEPYELSHRYRDPRIIYIYLQIINSIKRTKPDIIYVVSFGDIFLNLVLLMIDRTKTIIAIHDVTSHNKERYGKIMDLSRTILTYKFRYFHTFSQIQRNLLMKKVKGHNIYNISLPLIDFGPLPEVHKVEGETNFLFFGNILFYKGLDCLISAFNQLSKKYANASLTIAGRCDEWDGFYAKFVDPSSNINLHIRFIPNEEISTHFSKADYVVLPYRDTSQSGPLMISYNYNKPVIVSKADGFMEFTCDNVTGYSFNLDKEGDLQKVLEDCICLPKQDYDKLKKRQANYVENNFSITSLIDKYRKMFDQVFLQQPFM